MVKRDYGSIPFTRSIDTEALTNLCSKSAVKRKRQFNSMNNPLNGKSQIKFLDASNSCFAPILPEASECSGQEAKQETELNP
jgi:hypothetical protein